VSWATLAPALIVAMALAFMALERVFPYERDLKLLREGFWTDLLFYTLVQSYVMALVISAILQRLDAATGLSHLRLLAGWPVGAQVAFFVVSHDLYIYWFHRWQHHSPVLWRLHEAHHSAKGVDWLVATRSHALEILVNQTIEFAPMLLLGAAPQVPLIKSVIGAAWGMYIHSNLDVRTGRLQWIFNGPEAHRWHHAIDLDAHNRNFATKLALWDRLFRTAWLPRNRRPAGYGLDEVFPRGYIAQHLHAFRPFPPAADAPAAVEPTDKEDPCPGSFPPTRRQPSA
jgi:sterol desaturase/sphingolipid hydroxylase (fatty acid hydroxylase superfamily)